ncbi:putative dual specificity phosphatase [Rosellinia necatrix]|uniref:phosphatidylinositol-3,4,5-trisphosphate 3-phosphatase n=1 Tax=Rosellinia necatrix TaxID=77044 RepID=A0A1S7UH15_ROSNE|nr:putative dual specificity phosphatase [Rosellinia necatrix]
MAPESFSNIANKLSLQCNHGQDKANLPSSSGPSQTYPQRAYRNPLDRLVKFLDIEHGKNWAIWEFRAEGTGYPDGLVYNRIRHYPWPDHHPPPFRLVPMILASMRNWLGGNELDADAPGTAGHKSKLATQVLDALKDKKNARVVVVHCKAGKGRSGTIACSYLIAEHGWTPQEAIARFTERRMRPNFGPGVSIPSQVRWLSYVDRWTKGGKKYTDREIDVLEIHVWGLRPGVKLAVEGFVDRGKRIKVFHTFTKKERQIVEGNAPGGSGMIDMMYEMAGYGQDSIPKKQDSGGTENTPQKLDTNVTTTPPTESDTRAPATSKESSPKNPPRLISRMSRIGSPRPKGSGDGERSESVTATSPVSASDDSNEPEPGGMAVIFKPKDPIRIHNSDVNVTIERRHRALKSVGLTMVTAVAHVWFNAFFEGNGPEQGGVPDNKGVFEIEWDKLDGIKGSSQKGTRAADRIAVVWKSIVPEDGDDEVVIDQPRINAPVPQMPAADWKGDNDEDPEKGKHLGLRVQSPDSEGVSKASSIADEAVGRSESNDEEPADSFEGVRSDAIGEENGKDVSSDTSGGVASTKADSSRKNPINAYTEKLPSPEGRNA